MVDFKPGPVQLPTDETAPKRGPGRPRSVLSTKSLKAEISAMLMTLNLIIMLVPPLRTDAMDMVEMDALADALDEQARKSARFRKALEGALSAQSGGTLIGVLAIIGARRAARHGMLPAEADQMLGNLLAQGTQASKAARRDAGLAA